MAQEYRKIKEDLVKVQSRISLLTIDRVNHERIQEQCRKRVIECRDRLAKALAVPMATIIKGNFGRKVDGQE